MAKPVYWVQRTDQVEAITAPIRVDIIDRLVAVGPMSVRDLAKGLGRRPTAIYHHLKQLEDVGLIVREEQDEPAGQPGRPAAIYSAVGDPVRFSRAPERPANREPMARSARAVAAQAAKDYAAAFKAGNWVLQGPKRNHLHARVVCMPSPAKLARINALLDQLGSELLAHDPDHTGELISVAWFISPLGPRVSESKAKSKARPKGKAIAPGRSRKR